MWKNGTGAFSPHDETSPIFHSVNFMETTLCGKRRVHSFFPWRKIDPKKAVEESVSFEDPKVVPRIANHLVSNQTVWKLRPSLNVWYNSLMQGFNSSSHIHCMSQFSILSGSTVSGVHSSENHLSPSLPNTGFAVSRKEKHEMRIRKRQEER